MTTTKFEQWRRLGKLVDCNGHQIFMRDEGTGPTLLLIHGFPTSSWDWHKVWPKLTRHFRVLCLDMLGYGYSDKPLSGNYTTNYQVQIIVNLLKQLDIPNYHIMAYSYGVSVVQEMLSVQHETNPTIESICFLNGGLFQDSNYPTLSQRLLLGSYGKLFVKLFNQRTLAKNFKAIFGPYTQPTNELIAEYWALITVNQGKHVLPQLIQYLRERQNYGKQWELSLKRAACPIQLIVGAHDSISGIDVAHEFKQKISSNNVHILNNIGHYPQLESPDIVLAKYFAFVQKYRHAVSCPKR